MRLPADGECFESGGRAQAAFRKMLIRRVPSASPSLVCRESIIGDAVRKAKSEKQKTAEHVPNYDSGGDKDASEGTLSITERFSKSKYVIRLAK
jgi:hypothetical protein